MLENFIKNGLSIIPIRQGTKEPLVKWDYYQLRLPTIHEASKWSAPVAIVAGIVSGGIIAIDFDDNGSCFQAWKCLLGDYSKELADSLVIQKTPSGGYHCVFRFPGTDMGNKKIAQKEDKSVLIETRGEGGYFLAAPSEGYELIQGKWSKIPVVERKDFEEMIKIAKSFNRYGVQENKKHINSEGKNFCNYKVSPFDDYDSKADMVELLELYGWVPIRKIGNVVYFRRPGKEGRGISASWNFVPNRFFVFTTSTEFENEKVYKPSAVYSILKHGGDFKKAASELIRMGYGQRNDLILSKVFCENKKNDKIVSVEDFRDSIVNIQKVGFPKGISTGFKSLDEYYLVLKGQLNLITGIPSHGKSTFMDAIMVNMASREGWNFLVFSPENYPIELHFSFLAEKLLGKRFDKMTVDELSAAIDFIGNHFKFIPPSETGVSIEDILKIASENQIDGLVIDPWNSVSHNRQEMISETLYIEDKLKIVRTFARRRNVSTWIVAHPKKMQKEKKDDKYPVPDLYDVAGSANWYNMIDNGISVWRDFDTGISKISILKVKFKYQGKPGEVKLKYMAESGRYSCVEDETWQVYS